MDIAALRPGASFAVLDIETKPDGHAAALMRLNDRARAPSAIHRITAAAILTAREESDGSWTGFALDTPAEPALDEASILLGIDGALARLADEGGICVTFNGLAHDLPTIRRRAARHRLFAMPGVRAIDRIEHVDLMRRMTRGWRDEWPSLKAACAGLGIPVNHALAPPGGGDLTAAERKCQTDVACTFLLLLHELAMARGDGGVLERGWAGLAGLSGKPHAPPHLAQFARHDVFHAGAFPWLA